MSVTEKELLRVREISKDVEKLAERVEELDTKLHGIGSPSLEPSYGNNGDDAKTNMIVALDKLVNLYKQRLTEYYDAMLDVEMTISRMPIIQRQLIEYYYFDGMTWEKVAEKMNYSTARIYEMRNQTLERLKEM